jgi:hypothetical protein
MTKNTTHAILRATFHAFAINNIRSIVFYSGVSHSSALGCGTVNTVTLRRIGLNDVMQ